MRRIVASGWLIVTIAVAFVQTAAAQQAAHNANNPGRKWVVYLLPHSHVDIGYTHVQTEVERLQHQCLERALELCRKTADYPQGARFKWNAEVLWAVDSYLRQAPPEKQRQLVDAVRAGQFGLDALYGNELTGLCRPEELLRLMQWSVTIGRRCGVKVEAAMVDDVPGFTWGIVPAMAQAGVKYFSIGPNLNHRVGRALTAWEDKPFYWLAPDGQHKTLCWVTHAGYGYGDTIGYQLAERLPEYLAQLERTRYPYDIVQLHWSRGDNQPPDAALPDVVKNWNANHRYPKLVIATTAEAFRAFEKRYVDTIPAVKGDFTPNWEDGAASSARETALNRTSAERLVQAEALWAMLNPQQYPAEQSLEAWRNVILYDEHTWGARQYDVVDYDVPFIKDQWRIKQAFALTGDVQSRKILSTALAGRGNGPMADAVDIFNASGWSRTDLVVLSNEMSAAGDAVTGPDGKAVPSQRLSTGELAFLAKDVPALAGRRYAIGSGKAATVGAAKADGATLATSSVSVRLEPTSGAIVSLHNSAVSADLSDAKSGVGLNRYYYVVRDRVKEPRQAGPVKITVKESGPLVASLLAESDAPGCVKLSREIRVIDGLDRVDVDNVLDKTEVREKEGVHLGFAFNVPNGVMRIDIPWAVFRPEIDQLRGSCKEWLTVGRWVDVSNEEYGVTWATLDAPMIEVGAITADKLGPSSDPNLWLAKLKPSQTLYSYVMNNYWITNYRAFQSGPTTFRYRLLPHRQYNAAAAQRFGIECSQPLVIAAARGDAPVSQPLLELDTRDVIVASIKPSEDHKALIVRLFGVADHPAQVALQWQRRAPKAVWLSNLAEEPITAVTGPVDVPAGGLISLRAE
jgi:alpha-mannosidase